MQNLHQWTGDTLWSSNMINIQLFGKQSSVWRLAFVVTHWFSRGSSHCIHLCCQALAPQRQFLTPVVQYLKGSNNKHSVHVWQLHYQSRQQDIGWICDWYVGRLLTAEDHRWSLIRCLFKLSKTQCYCALYIQETWVNAFRDDDGSIVGWRLMQKQYSY
jgi:hypothetical protein